MHVSAIVAAMHDGPQHHNQRNDVVVGVAAWVHEVPGGARPHPVVDECIRHWCGGDLGAALQPDECIRFHLRSSVSELQVTAAMGSG